jgi:hypothetical protein
MGILAASMRDLDADLKSTGDERERKEWEGKECKLRRDGTGPRDRTEERRREF